MQAFMNQAEAAEYCGYSVDTFRRHLRRYPMPRFGPKKNRFKLSVLDSWMEDPGQFEVETRSQRPEKLLSRAEQRSAVWGYSFGSILIQ